MYQVCVWYYISSKLVASRSNNGTFGHRRAFSLPLNASFPFGWKPPCRLRLYPVVIIPRNIQARIVHPGWPRLALLTPAREYTAFKSSDFKDLPPPVHWSSEDGEFLLRHRENFKRSVSHHLDFISLRYEDECGYFPADILSVNFSTRSKYIYIYKYFPFLPFNVRFFICILAYIIANSESNYTLFLHRKKRVFDTWYRYIFRYKKREREIRTRIAKLFSFFLQKIEGRSGIPFSHSRRVSGYETK